jgi:glycosyltransferase involved in cell wall biosynthesis
MQSVRKALDDVREALPSSTVGTRAAAWLLLTAVDGSYPSERDVEQAAHALRAVGARSFTGSLERRGTAALAAGSGSDLGFDVLTDSVVVDVSQIAASDLHTGIQRVARECVSHWLRAGFSLHLSCFDGDAGVSRLLGADEAERLRQWQNHLGEDAKTATRCPSFSENILVPWGCDLVLTELLTPEHSAALRGLVVSGVHRSLSLVFYDLIPFMAPEFVGSSLVTTLASHMAVLKHADRVSAISAQSADDIRAFVSMLAGQGLRGPEVIEHALPTEAPSFEDPAAVVESTPSSEHDRSPVVLVVGVQASHKNHVAVVEAAERLWRHGQRFELVFIGGNAWRADAFFDARVHTLQRAGRPIRLERRVSEEELWKAYRSARFTVFPSLIEGFGLPVAESLAAGTPVITSNYGSMAEIAAGGGALMVDPRNIDDLEGQMRRLLEDDLLLERLRSEARGLDMGTWSGYAHTVWNYFFPGRSGAE